MDALKRDSIPDSAARRQAALVLEDRLARSVAAVKANPNGTFADADDPLGDRGRRAMAKVDEPHIRRALTDWVNAHQKYWDAARDLSALMADDPLRGGRYQRIYEAGLRWRRQVLVERRAAFMAAARTAQRAVLVLHREAEAAASTT